MAKIEGIEVSIAVANAVKLANVDVVSAYPITPQTHIVEHLAHLVADDELDAAYIPVESEHSALSACMGASAVGARSFTATAGQGLELMHEVLFATASMRLPIVMALVNRALSAPISIWGDHSDVMAARDTGWIQIFVENGQEAVDNILCAFRIAEDRRVLIPVMINLDGFHLSHVVEPIYMPEPDKLDGFIPPYKYPFPLDPDKPVTMGGLALPALYAETKKAQDVVLRESKKVIMECWEEFERRFNRRYSPVERYQSEGAKYLLLTMGSYSETAELAVDKMRKEGKNVGLLKLRLWRPFPFEEMRQAVKDAEAVIVLDRALSFGGPGGPVCSELKSAFYNMNKKIKVVGFVGGLGGRDITVEGFEDIINKGIEVSQKGSEQEFEMFGVRE